MRISDHPNGTLCRALHRLMSASPSIAVLSPTAQMPDSDIGRSAYALLAHDKALVASRHCERTKSRSIPLHRVLAREVGGGFEGIARVRRWNLDRFGSRSTL